MFGAGRHQPLEPSFRCKELTSSEADVSLPPEPAEAAVHGLVHEVDEVSQSGGGDPPQIRRHQDFGDLVEVPGEREIANPCLHQIDVLAQQHR